MERQGLPGWKILVVLTMLGVACWLSAGGPEFPEADKRFRWQDLRVSLAAAKLVGTSDPTFTAVRGKAYAYAFSPSQENELFCTVQLPHGFTGSTIDPHLHWMATNNTVATIV